MDERTRRSPARFLAPLALIAVLVAFLAVVTGSGSNGSSSSASSAATTTTGSSTATKKTAAKKNSRRSTSGSRTKSAYTVQVGDTLGAIATKTGVSLSTIESLNPNVDPHALVAGQQIRLK
jgi:LysM repeat protein